MNYHYGNLAETVVKRLVETSDLERILSIDLETKVLKEARAYRSLYFSSKHGLQ